MRDTDLAYLAGIIDGEGSISMESHGNRLGIPRPRRFAIQVTMAEEAIVQSLKEAFGGHIVMVKPRKPKYKVLWRWRVTATAAKQAYGLLKPYLRRQDFLKF